MKTFSSCVVIAWSFVRRRSSLLQVLLFNISLFSSVVFAETSSAANQLALQLANQPNFTADFTQQSFSSEGILVDRSSGRIVLSRPFHLRWETKVPFEQTIIINGDRYLQYDSDIDQLIISSLGGQDTAIPSLLLSADALAIESIFSVTRVDIDPDDDVDNHSAAVNDDRESSSGKSYGLTPLDSGSLIAELRINFQQQMITSIVILDNFGSRSQFNFTKITAKKVLDSALFELDPPTDTDIIYR